MKTALSYLAPNQFWLFEVLTRKLGSILNTPIHLAQGEGDPLDDPYLLDADVAFLCGLPLVRINRYPPKRLAILAAPILNAPRYAGKAVYFADFIVRADSPAQSLADVQGTVFAFNDSGSNSGYYLPRYHLLQNGFRSGHFGKLIQSHAHQHSIRFVLDGRADCAAIDSTVLEQFARDYPAEFAYLRVVASTQACPVPPITVSTRYGAAVIERMRAVLQQPDAELADALCRAGIAGYAFPTDDDYAIIGKLLDAVNDVDYRLAG